MTDKNQYPKRLFTILFLISQVYWFWMLWIVFDNFTNGINAGWVAPALSNPDNVVYGFETIDDSVAMIIIITFMSPFIIIPIYQFIFIIVALIKKRKIYK